MASAQTTVGEIGEFALIGLLSKIVGKGNRRVVAGIGDDAAVMDFPSSTGTKFQLLTTDMLIEDVHFKKSMGAAAIGRKSLACSLSDIAAMGGDPTFAVVSLGVPARVRVEFVRSLYRGMWSVARRAGVSIVGGDTVQSRKIIVSVALLGEVAKKDLVTRRGARPGDKIFVTGPLGRSLKSGRHLTFRPKFRESHFLIKYFRPTAMMDISDGIAGDLNHLLNAGHVGAVVYAQRIPRSKGATLNEALTDGEDFELLFTVSGRNAEKLESLKGAVSFYYIGDIVDRRRGYHLVDAHGRNIRFSKKGFVHF